MFLSTIKLAVVPLFDSSSNLSLIVIVAESNLSLFDIVAVILFLVVYPSTLLCVIVIIGVGATNPDTVVSLVLVDVKLSFFPVTVIVYF